MDPEMLMQMIMGGGGAGAPPASGGMPPPGAPPAEMGMDPMAAMMAGAPPQAGPSFPSTDPSVLQQLLSQLGEMRQGDHMALQQEQDSVLMTLLQAMGIGGVDPMSGFAEGGEQPMTLPEQGMMAY